MTAKHKRSARKSASKTKTPPRESSPKHLPSIKKSPSSKKPASGRRGRWAWVSLTNKWFVLLSIVLIAAFAFLIRSLHLFDSGHYYIISADSHVFHWMADNIMDGQPIPDKIPSGLAYPLAYIANAIGFVFNLSDESALTFVSKYLPPFLGVLTAIILYLVISRIYDRRLGLMSALAWAVLPHAYFIQGAGYLDRDAISVPLVMIGAFVFLLCKRWHVKLRGRDVGWILGAFLVLIIELLIFLEWSWVGPGLLITIITAYFAAELVVKFLEYEHPSQAAKYQTTWQRLRARAKGALRESKWQPFVLIVGLNFLAAIINMGATSRTFDFIHILLSPGGGNIAELGGFGLTDLALFQFFIILIPIGIFLAVMRRRELDILCLSWFLVLFILSLFSRRVILYAAPAAAILGAIVLANLLDFRYSRRLERSIQMIVAVIVLAVLVGLSSMAYDLGSERRIAANDDWQDGLVYLRDNTPEDAVVMTWWDFGYWVLDMAQRKPVVDGGLYGHSRQQDDDIGRAYLSNNASETAEIMREYGADYLIFSKVEMEIMPVIAWHGTGRDTEDTTVELADTIYIRSLTGDFESGGGLERVYPAPEIADPGLVILGLKEE